MYHVYVHTFPNGKIYVGQAKDLILRWNNGEGYADNRPMYKDIQVYGWGNIKHEVIAEFPSLEAALKFESVMIALLRAEDKEYGYNQTNIYEDAMKKYISRTEFKGIAFERSLNEESFFEFSKYPVSVCKELIEQWIFNKDHRMILKDRLIDGMTYSELSKKYGKSVRRLKTIVYQGCDKIEKHF